MVRGWPVRYRFADFTLDTERFELQRAGEPIPLEPKALSLLAHLLEQAPRLVPKGELLDAVWGDVAVGDGSLLRAASLARHALGDRERAEKILRTVRGRGYGIGVRVGAEEASSPTSASRSEVFVGREKELAQARGALDAARAGRGQILLLAGEPGIGKTRLAEMIAAEARDRGFEVLWGRCWEGEGGPAFWPWVQVLREAVRARDAEQLVSEMGTRAADIADVVPEVREALQQLGEATPLEPEHAQFRFFDSTTLFLRNAAQRQSLLVLLDDLQAADASSLKLLEFLASQLGEAAVLVLGTYRDAEVRADSPLERALAELSRTGRSLHRLELARFSPEEVANYLAMGTALDASPELVCSLHARTDGNPLYVREVSAWLQDQASDPAEALEAGLPTSLRQVVGQRLAALSPDCQQLLVAASVVGREFDVALLARALGWEPGRVLELVAQAEAARVVEAFSGSFRFSHALLNETLYLNIAPDDRPRLHVAVGEALEALTARRESPPLADLAHHFTEGALAGGAGRALDYTERAGDQATDQLAIEDAAELYGGAVDLCEAQGVADPRRHASLVLKHGVGLLRAARPKEGNAACWRAVELARRIDAGEILAEAASEISRTLNRMEVLPECVALVEEALAALPDGSEVLRAKLLRARAVVRYWDTDRGRYLELAQEALSAARQVGDAELVSDALWLYRDVFAGPDRDDERRSLGEERLRLARHLRDPDREFKARDHVLRHWIELAEPIAIDREIEACRRLAERLGVWWRATDALQQQAARATWQGRLAVAEALLHESARYAMPDSRFASTAFGFSIALLRRLQGRLAELEPAIRRRRDAGPDNREFSMGCHRAVFHAEMDQPAEALEAFRAIMGAPLRDHSQDMGFCYHHALLAETCAYLGDRQQAPLLHAYLLPFARRYVSLGVFAALGCASRYLGLLDTLLERYDDAERHFEDALEVERRMQARPWEAYALRDYARTLGARDGPGDRERAEALAVRSLEIAREIGMKGLEAKLAPLVGREVA